MMHNLIAVLGVVAMFAILAAFTDDDYEDDDPDWPR